MCYVHSNRIPQNNLMSTVLGVPVGHRKQIVWRLSFPVRFNGLATLYKPLSCSSKIYLALLETDQAEPLAYKHKMVGDIFWGQKLGTITLFNKMQHKNEWIKENASIRRYVALPLMWRPLYEAQLFCRL